MTSDVKELVEQLRSAYEKVKLWPEKRMSANAVEALGPGFTDLLELRNLVPAALEALSLSQGLAVKPLEWCPFTRYEGDDVWQKAQAGQFEQAYEIEPPYKGIKGGSFRIRRSTDINAFAWADTFEDASYTAAGHYRRLRRYGRRCERRHP